MASIRFDVTLFFFVLLRLISSEKCTNPLPALMQMAAGVDITALDLFTDLGEPGDNHGLLENVFNFTCSGGKMEKLEQIDLSNYDVPDHITLVKIPDNSGDAVSSMTNVTSVKRTLMNRLGLEYDKESSLGAFSRNLKYTSLLKQHFVSEKVFSQAEINSESIRSTLNQVELHLSDDFTEFIHKLPPKYEDNPAAYQTFVKRFGTHYFSQVYLSDWIYALFTLNHDYMFDSNDEKIGANVRVAFYDHFKKWNLVWNSIKYKLVDRETFANVSEIALAFNNAQMNASQWVNMLTGTMYIPTKSNEVSIRDAELKPIEQLIEDESKQTQVAIAVRVHRIKAQIEELTNIYKFSSKFYQLSAEENVAFEKVKMFVNLVEVKQIDQMVTIVNELYDKALMARDKTFYGLVIDDLYVIASAKLEFAKQICAFSIRKLLKGQSDRQCPGKDIVKGQQMISDLYEDYHRQQSGSWEPSNTGRDDNSDYSSILKRARSLNLDFGMRDQLTSGLKAICDVCT